MLHMRKSGMKSVRANESVNNRLADQMTTLGYAQIVRPTKSPILNTRKWYALKSKGCTSGRVEMIDVVIGGNTDCVLDVSIYSSI